MVKLYDAQAISHRSYLVNFDPNPTLAKSHSSFPPTSCILTFNLWYIVQYIYCSLICNTEHTRGCGHISQQTIGIVRATGDIYWAIFTSGEPQMVKLYDAQAISHKSYLVNFDPNPTLAKTHSSFPPPSCILTFLWKSRTCFFLRSAKRRRRAVSGHKAWGHETFR